mgnify:CR=1 FL=1
MIEIGISLALFFLAALFEIEAVILSGYGFEKIKEYSLGFWEQ